MAPRKEKSDKAGNDQGSALIIEYLKKQNRPYSAVDISANLHNKVTKSYAVKTLKELHDQQTIAGKASGKQIVYHAIQDSQGAASPEDMAGMDKELERLRESVATAKSNEKLLKANLVTVNATLSSEDLRASITALELEQRELLARLGPLRTDSVTPVSAEEKQEADNDWRQWSRNAALRKRFCMEMWSYCTEELPEGQTKEELWEELGLEGDE